MQDEFIAAGGGRSLSQGAQIRSPGESSHAQGVWLGPPPLAGGSRAKTRNFNRGRSGSTARAHASAELSFGSARHARALLHLPQALGNPKLFEIPTPKGM